MSGSEGGYLVPDGLVKFILEGSWVDHFSPLPGWEMKLVRTFAAKLVGLRHSKARMFGKWLFYQTMFNWPTYWPGLKSATVMWLTGDIEKKSWTE